MVASTEQIKREIKALENTTSAIADEVSELYARYLTTLGQSVRQQLILACYHLCTQNYPERFLRLSFSQRQKLQQAIKGLGKQAEQQLIEQTDVLQQVLGLADEPVEEEMDADLGESEELGERSEELEELEAEALGDRELGAGEQGSQGVGEQGSEGTEAEGVEGDGKDEEENSPDSELLETITPEALARIVQEIEKNPALAKDAGLSARILPLSSALSLDFAIAGRQDSPFSSAVKPGEPLSPMQLVDILEKLEYFIAEILQGASQAANRLLQKADILPRQLPEPVFAAAAKAGEAAEGPSSGPPNLLRLLVEVAETASPTSDLDEADDENEDEDEDEDEPLRLPVTPLVAIHLRLSEIEFTTATLSVWRTKIRGSVKQLEGLSRKYKRKQQQLAIAEAESAWRSSWFED
ncbi:MAG: hypothetical protein ACTS2F_13975 [Thainema sp.]